MSNNEEGWTSAETIERAAACLQSKAKVTFDREATGVTFKMDPAPSFGETVVLPEPSQIVSDIATLYYLREIDRIAGIYQLGTSLRESYYALASKAKKGDEDAKMELFAKKTVRDRVGNNLMIDTYPGSAELRKRLDDVYPAKEAAEYCNTLLKKVRLVIERRVESSQLAKVFKNVTKEDLALLYDVAELGKELVKEQTLNKNVDRIEEELYELLQNNKKCQDEMKCSKPEGVIGEGDGKGQPCSASDGDKEGMEKKAEAGCTYDPKSFHVTRFTTAANTDPGTVAKRNTGAAKLIPLCYRKFFGNNQSGKKLNLLAGPQINPKALLRYKTQHNFRIFQKPWTKRAENCTVYFCVDLSGSMSGAPKELVVNAMQTLGVALERSGIKCGMYGFGSSFMVFKEPEEATPTCGNKFYGLHVKDIPDLGGTSGWETMHELVKRVTKATTDRQILFMGTDGGWCSYNQALDNSIRWWLKEFPKNRDFRFIPLGIGTSQSCAQAYANELVRHLQLPADEILTAVVSNPDDLIPQFMKCLDKHLEEGYDD